MRPLMLQRSRGHQTGLKQQEKALATWLSRRTQDEVLELKKKMINWKRKMLKKISSVVELKVCAQMAKDIRKERHRGCFHS